MALQQTANRHTPWDFLPDYVPRTTDGVKIVIVHGANTVSVEDRMTISFDSGEIAMKWLRSIHEDGRVEGERTALHNLQLRAQEFIKDVFGVDLK